MTYVPNPPPNAPPAEAARVVEGITIMSGARPTPEPLSPENAAKLATPADAALLRELATEYTEMFDDPIPARLRALSGELDELRKDKARMDWLSQPRAGGVTIGINAPGQLPAASLYLDEGTEPFDGSSLRDALDHAMAHPESCGCYRVASQRQ